VKFLHLDILTLLINSLGNTEIGKPNFYLGIQNCQIRTVSSKYVQKSQGFPKFPATEPGPPQNVQVFPIFPIPKREAPKKFKEVYNYCPYKCIQDKQMIIMNQIGMPFKEEKAKYYKNMSVKLSKTTGKADLM
jgi:hypothetical protein